MATGAVGLPEGFTLDKKAPQESSLPPGFTLDMGPGGTMPVDDRPFGDRATQFVGGMNRGVASALDQVLNAPQRIYNVGAQGWNELGEAWRERGKPGFLKELPQRPDPNFAQRLMEAAGGTRPVSLDDYVGGLLDRVGQFAGAAALPLGPVKSVGQLAKQVAGGTAAGVSATAAGEVAKTVTDNPAIQMGAEVAGSLLPAGAALGTSLATKAAMRGGATPAQVAANTEQLRAAGIEPTVGQATGNIAAQGAENILARTPFAGLPIVRRAQAQVDAIGKDLAEASRTLSAVREKPAVGGMVQRDLTKFVDDAGPKFVALDNEFKALFPPDRAFPIDNTLAALGRLSKISPEVPGFSAGLKDPKIQSWAERLGGDVSDPNFKGVSMQSLLDLRTDIGANVQKSALLGKKDAQYSALYDAVRKDIGAAAKGTPAEALLARRDNYWEAFRKRTDNYLTHIADNPDKTQAYLDVIGDANVGREQLLAVRRSVSPETWKSVASAKLTQMARDTELGEFSLQKFVTEYKKLSDRPMGSNSLSPADALFGGMGMLKRDLDTIVAASEKVLSGGRVYQNPSGTSTATVGMVAGAGLAVSVFERLLMGDTTGAAIRGAGGAAAFGGARGLANVMVNPKTVDWLAKSTRIPADKAGQYLQRLTPIIAEIPDPDQRKKMEAWRNDMRKSL